MRKQKTVPNLEQPQREPEGRLVTPETFALSIVNDIVQKVIEKKHKGNSKTPVSLPSSPIPPEKKEKKEGHYVYNDCYLVFNALCKLSMKPLSKE